AMLDGPAIERSFGAGRLARELDVMRASGVETIRVVWSWEQTQPYAAWEAVPEAERRRFRDVGGLPLAVARLDRLVEQAARRDMRVLPVTVETPSWLVRRLGITGSPPREVGPYGDFMRALVGRYGSRGSFWRERPQVPRRPVRWWQLWNEPHLRGYWNEPRWAPDYSALVRAGARAVHATDRQARVVLAGMTTDRIAAWDHLDAVLAEGVGPEVDMVGAHVFTRRPRDVVRALTRFRRTLRAYGLGRTPIALTEWSWPSSRGERSAGGLPWETTRRGQAKRVERTLRLLARERRRLRLRTTVYYTWLSRDRGRGWAGWGGLRELIGAGRVASKPALAAFRRVALALRRAR
ncbi:MAG TPA: hypothetical protein VF587_19970, partial [Solirubrobacteraceae bacterium]